MTEELKEFEGLAEKLKAIGHPVRVAILNLICTCGCNRLTVKSIYERLNLDQPSVSRHLSIMRNTGVLERIQEANSTYYCLCDEDPQVACIKRCFAR